MTERATPWRQLVHGLGPAIGAGSAPEALRAGFGALFGLAVTGLFLMTPQADLRLGLYLIAPFGATAVLLFAVPNSPLAQPWSALVGNMTAALVGVLACMLLADPTWRIAVAVGVTIVATIGLRAVHPPAGAVAMTAAMNPEAVAKLGFGFVLAPVGLGTLVLIVIAVIYARATGRHYPFRQFSDPGPHGTADPAPSERLGLSHDDLAGILQSYRQTLNLGVEDLARLIGAAELQAASHRSGPLTVGQIMSRDLLTVAPDTRIDMVADLFREHDFTSVPVVEDGDRYMGMIYQIDLIRRAGDDAFRYEGGFGPAMSRLIRRDGDAPGAGQVMRRDVPQTRPDTPVGALLPLLSDGGSHAVPVLTKGRIVGIVTQTDLIAALARQSLRRG